MDTVFLLDKLDVNSPYASLAKSELSFALRNKHAKRFMIGSKLGEKIHELFKSNPELYTEQRKFAKPPFDEVYVEFDYTDTDTGTTERNVVGVLWAEDKAVVLVEGPTQVHLSRIAVKISEDGLLAVDQRPDQVYQKESPKSQMVEHAIYYTAMVEILWLLMHRPGVVISKQVPGRQKVVKGKLRPARAHSVLTIDLTQKDLIARIMADGSRGSGVREHEVRGTWVHLNHVRSCTHQWGRVDRPIGRAECWSCPTCGTRRVWRIPHVRGEHKRGNKFHTYAVKDSNLED